MRNKAAGWSRAWEAWGKMIEKRYGNHGSAQAPTKPLQVQMEALRMVSPLRSKGHRAATPACPVAELMVLASLNQLSLN